MNSVAFVSQRLKKEYDSLAQGDDSDRQLHKYIDRAIDDLKKNPTSGTRIPKKLWPYFYVKKFDITNLWKYDLPNGWRLIYMIKADDVMIVSIILEWFKHKRYERRFDY